MRHFQISWGVKLLLLGLKYLCEDGVERYGQYIAVSPGNIKGQTIMPEENAIVRKEKFFLFSCEVIFLHMKRGKNKIESLN